MPKNSSQLPSCLLRPKEAARMMGRAVHTLAVERMTGNGCPFVKLGGTVLYDPEDIRKFIDKNRRTSTSQTSQHRNGKSNALVDADFDDNQS
jgi:hypothetical protein